jgi:hypothetical protein
METITIKKKNVTQKVTDKQLKYLLFLLSKNDSVIQDKVSLKEYLDKWTASKLIQGSIKGNVYDIIFEENVIIADCFDEMTSYDAIDIFMNSDLSGYSKFYELKQKTIKF